MPDCNIVLVIFVVFLITYIPASLHLFVLPDYLPLTSSSHWATWLYYAAFDASVLLIWINYYLSVRAPAGFVPSSYTPPTTLAPDTLLEIKQTTAKPRYCRSCSTYKPPRSHHCSTCNRCVLKMDHHCPWTNNCIGYYNQAHFVRFLLYVTLATSLCNSVCFAYLYHLVYAPAYPMWYYNDQVFIRLVATCITLVLSGPVWLMVGGLSCYHIYYVSTNCTTIESMEKDRKALVRRHDGRVGSVVNPYRLGVWANWACVFGEASPVWMWFLWSTPHGDGLTWKVNEQAEWEYVNAEPDSHPQPVQDKMQAHVRRDSDDGYVVDMQRHPYGGYYKYIEQREQEARKELDVVVVNRRRNDDGAHARDDEVWSDMSDSDRSYSGSSSESPSSSEDDDDDEDNVPLFQASIARRLSANEAASGASRGGMGRGKDQRQPGRSRVRRGRGGGGGTKKNV
ncbi:DHHC palmitoyltransferase-domain-containing protein [Catenaria anguillulae PL171]|uniref:Palmitoyltransferase n=1 Tax=Catenaria anguillulae PL171 TaxID=765915 RepID=A0A1Y2HBS7_9FUNG|nr:DHHC palmitoyltransferase-domain-containing protein [Catenaria anguillulae PL171]